jgi:hypothetical protein
MGVTKETVKPGEQQQQGSQDMQSAKTMQQSAALTCLDERRVQAHGQQRGPADHSMHYSSMFCSDSSSVDGCASGGAVALTTPAVWVLQQSSSSLARPFSDSVAVS